MMLRHSPSRKQRAKILWVKRGVQTCLVLAFSVWVVNQVKLSLADGSIRKTDDLTPEDLSDKQKFVGDEPLKLTRKGLLRVGSEVVARNDTDGVKEKSEGDDDKEEEIEESTEEWMERLDFEFREKDGNVNDTSKGDHSAEGVDDSWESTLVNGGENFESFDPSVFQFDQYEKEDTPDLEVVEETGNVDEVRQEDARDQR